MTRSGKHGVRREARGGKEEVRCTERVSKGMERINRG